MSTVGYPIEVIVPFGAICLGLLAVDLYSHRGNKPVNLRAAVAWSLFYVAAALVFAGWLWIDLGREAAALFMAGYTLEKMLSVDNLFVWMAIFAAFRVGPEFQHRILHWGILGAVVFRLLFVAIGTGTLVLFGPAAEAAFGAIILFTAYKMLTAKDDGEVDYTEAWYVRWAKKWLPVTAERDGAKFFIKGCATPLFICMIAVEVTDVLFAFDSVPAIIAVTRDPLLVYSSMIFAILGLRSLYFVLEAMKRSLAYLETAVIAILVFIGAKVLAHATIGLKVDTMVSLGIVLSVLTAGVVVSLITRPKEA